MDSHPAAILHDVLDKKYILPEQPSEPYSFFLPFFLRVKEEHGIDLIDDGRARILDHREKTKRPREMEQMARRVH